LCYYFVEEGGDPLWLVQRKKLERKKLQRKKRNNLAVLHLLSDLAITCKAVPIIRDGFFIDENNLPRKPLPTLVKTSTPVFFKCSRIK
jgi:hypothetical protein